MFVLLLLSLNSVQYAGDYDTYDACKRAGDVVVSQEYKNISYLTSSNIYGRYSSENGVMYYGSANSSNKTYVASVRNYTISCNKK